MSGDDAGGQESGLPGVVLAWRFASSPGGQGSTLQVEKKNLIKYVNTGYRRQNAFQLALFRSDCFKLCPAQCWEPELSSYTQFSCCSDKKHLKKGRFIVAHWLMDSPSW